MMGATIFRGASAGALSVLLLAGCGAQADSTAPLLATARLAGEFTAETAVFTDAADPDNRFDVISQDGELRFDLDRDGRFVETLVVPGREVFVRTGSIAVSGDRLNVRDDGIDQVRVVPFEFDGRVLTFRDPGVSFDFDGAGSLRPAVLDTRLVR